LARQGREAGQEATRQVPVGVPTTIRLAVHIERRMAMKLTSNVGMLLLGIWLILSGLIPLLNLGFSGLGTLMLILAIVAGVFILLGR
jgi:hypothetical protein